MPRLNTPRTSHQVLWLPDGRMFTIGGRNINKLKSVEMSTRAWDFNGKTKKPWRKMAPMLTARARFAAVNMKHIILVAGGKHSSGDYANPVEIFTLPSEGDGRSIGQWTRIPSMIVPVTVASAVVSSGHLYVFGTFICYDFAYTFQVR